MAPCDVCLLQGFVRLGPIKKSLSISRKSGKVKEEFTLKGVYESLDKLTKVQQHLFATVQSLSTGQAKVREICGAQDKKIADLATVMKDSSVAIQGVTPSIVAMKDDIIAIAADLSATVQKSVGSPRPTDKSG